MMRKSEYALWALLVLAVLAAGSTMVSLARSQSASAANSEIYRQLDLFGEVLERVRSDYVEKPDDAKLLDHAARHAVANELEVDRVDGAVMAVTNRDGGEDADRTIGQSHLQAVQRIATHLIDEVSNLLEHVLILNRGRLLIDADADTLRSGGVDLVSTYGDIEVSLPQSWA